MACITSHITVFQFMRELSLASSGNSNWITLQKNVHVQPAKQIIDTKMPKWYQIECNKNVLLILNKMRLFSSKLRRTNPIR